MRGIVIFLLLTFGLFANIGTIADLKGSVKVYRTTKIIDGKMKMDINKGDKLISSARSKVKIVLNDGTVVTIGANSSFQFDDYFFDGSSKSLLKMRANRGFFRSVTGKIGKVAPERFKVRTRSSTIGIRGTDFSVRMYENLEKFKCYSGEIRIVFGSRHKDLKPSLRFFELKKLKSGKWIGNNLNNIFLDNFESNFINGGSDGDISHENTQSNTQPY